MPARHPRVFLASLVLVALPSVAQADEKTVPTEAAKAPFDHDAAMAALKAISFSDCGTELVGGGRVQIIFRADGTVSTVVVVEGAYSLPTQRCMAGRFSKARVAAFDDMPERKVDFAFALSARPPTAMRALPAEPADDASAKEDTAHTAGGFAAEAAGGWTSGTMTYERPMPDSDREVHGWSAWGITANLQLGLGGPWRLGVGGGYQSQNYPEYWAKVRADAAEVRLFVGLAFRSGLRLVEHGPRIGLEGLLKAYQITDSFYPKGPYSHSDAGLGLSYVVAVKLVSPAALVLETGVRVYSSLTADLRLLIGCRFGSTGP